MHPVDKDLYVVSMINCDVNEGRLQNDILGMCNLLCSRGLRYVVYIQWRWQATSFLLQEHTFIYQSKQMYLAFCYFKLCL